MKRVLVVACCVVFIQACPKRDQPPASSYDPDLVDTARQLVEESRNVEQAPLVEEKEQPKGECSRLTGGCPAGYLCWDSWFCKKGLENQCSAAGDKNCHKLCNEDLDCPQSEPTCVEKPIFNGSDRGVLEKFCVGE